MGIYTCQVTRPKKSTIYQVTATSVADAANETHFKARIQIQSGLEGHPCFAVVAVDGVECLSRVFYEGIGREGGIKRQYPRIESIAEQLGFPVEDFLGEFEGEEMDGRSIQECGCSVIPV